MKRASLSSLLAPILLSLATIGSTGASAADIVFRPGPGLNDGTDSGSLAAGKDTTLPGCLGLNGTSAVIQGFPRSYCNHCNEKGYIRFDVSTLPAAVSQVFLSLEEVGVPGCHGGNCEADFYFYLVTEDWNEIALGEGTASPPAEGSPVLGPLFRTSVGPGTPSAHREYDITDVYRGWKDGSIPNHGLVVYSPQGTCNNDAARFLFYSSDAAEAAHRPALRIVTKPAAPSEPFVARNNSYPTTCAEEDNVNIPLWAKAPAYFEVLATHPRYVIAQDNCAADFSGCGAADATTTASLRSANMSCQEIYNNGHDVFNLCTEQAWWRPNTMTVKVQGASHQGHRLVLNSKIADAPSWPEVLVIYQDGNVRTKPHPPVGVPDVCFGSSVILGPAAEDALRPFVDIAQIDIDAAGRCFRVTYGGGERSHLCLTVDRQAARVSVGPNPVKDRPFATFRSMWVAHGNADVDHVVAGVQSDPILGTWTELSGPSWTFERQVLSQHNTSAPDIRIRANDVETNLLRPVWHKILRP